MGQENAIFTNYSIQNKAFQPILMCHQIASSRHKATREISPLSLFLFQRLFFLTRQQTFPPWDQNVPTLGMKCSHGGNETTLTSKRRRRTWIIIEVPLKYRQDYASSSR